MRVFLTGATGFIGSRIVPELQTRGHRVIGLTRTDAGARQLADMGAEAHRGTLEDPDSLAAGAAAADAVIHTAFDHDFAKFLENCEKDRRAITAMGDALAGTGKPFLITSGTGMGERGPGEPATEDTLNLDHPNPRIASELASEAAAAKGASVAVVRLPQVHDTAKQGLISSLIELARASGVSAYVGDGANRWPAAHVSDVARLYAMALDAHQAGARYNAVAEEGVPARDIATVIGAGLGVPVRALTPEEATAHFGWLAMFVALDMTASGTATRARLGWQPTGPGLLADLQGMDWAR